MDQLDIVAGLEAGLGSMPVPVPPVWHHPGNTWAAPEHPHRMAIDIDKITEAGLIDLNRRIIERLHFTQQARAHVAMLHFRIGDRVCFEPDGRGPMTGIITRYNRKTVRTTEPSRLGA